MSAARLALVHGLIAAIVGGSAYDIVRDREHWPFSQYPMFAPAERDWTHRTLRVFSVTEDGREQPVLESAALRPFDQCRLSTAFLRLRRDGEAVRRALADTYQRLERNTGDRDTAALRLYELRWNLQPGRAHDAQPDARAVIAEYRPDLPR